jgi:hypothetical protein
MFNVVDLDEVSLLGPAQVLRMEKIKVEDRTSHLSKIV